MNYYSAIIYSFLVILVSMSPIVISADTKISTYETEEANISRMNTIKKLENYLQQAVESEHLSGVVMVVQNGKILINQGYGMATAEGKNDKNTVLHVASITKQFTAAAIMKLWEAGKIDLNLPINKYLPEKYLLEIGQVDAWEKVTVHHLLSHTGGIADYGNNYYDAEKKGFCFKDTFKTMIDESRGKGLEFEPGTRWNYSNIGYTLLGAIIENVTGRPYSEMIQKYFFIPVGMSSSGIHEEDYDAKKDVKNVYATGHRWDKKQKKLVDDDEISLPVTPSDGGMYTTSEDLHKWSNIITGKRPDILSHEILKQMTTSVQNTSKDHDYGYGYGLFIDESSGARRINHPGWIVGFRSHFCFYPDKDIYISVFCNNTATNPTKIMSRLSEIMGEQDG